MCTWRQAQTTAATVNELCIHRYITTMHASCRNEEFSSDGMVSMLYDLGYVSSKYKRLHNKLQHTTVRGRQRKGNNVQNQYRLN